MKFGKYLLDKERESWKGKYLDYASLKDLIKLASKEFESQGFADHSVYSPRAASLTVLRADNARDSAEEQFFQKLEDEVDKIGGFTSEQVQSLRSRLYELQQRIGALSLHQMRGPEAGAEKAKLQDELLVEAKDIGDEFLQLEKYVNLNYMGFHKILKKHDKQLPLSPCRQFYISHLHNQPWVQGSYADLLVTLGHVYAEIRGDEATPHGDEQFAGSSPRASLVSHGSMMGTSPPPARRLTNAANSSMGSSPGTAHVGASIASEGTMPRVPSAYKILKSRTKYWVDVRHVSKVKHAILPHLPVYQFDENEYTGDSQLVNSVYLDNANLEVYHSRLKEDGRYGMVVKMSWYGSQEPLDVHVQVRSLVCWLVRRLPSAARALVHSRKCSFIRSQCKDMSLWTSNANALHDEGDMIQDPTGDGLEMEFILPSSMILSFIEDELDARDVVEFWRSRGLYSDETELQTKLALFEDLKKLVDSKQMKPVLRSQYMRTYFQIPFDKTVQIKMDSNITMMKENPDNGPSCVTVGRWFRDPSLPVHRTEVTRFPHAVLDLKLSLTSNQETPAWVQELVSSGDLEEMNNFSKQLHGMTTLFPDLVQSVPYWIDRDSVRASMMMSAPVRRDDIALNARDVSVPAVKPRSHWTTEEGELLRNASIMDSARDRTASPRAEGAARKLYTTPKFIEWWFSKPPMKKRPNIPGRVEQKLEPKTFFANERTFLSWLNMALTMGSIATAMIGMSSGDSIKDNSTLIALILLPAAVFMCAYSVVVYYWRSDAIMQHREVYYDDRRGPFALTAIVVSCLGIIMSLGAVDLFHQLTAPSY